MQFTESLKKNFQFRHVYQKGKSIANRHLVLYMVKNGTHDHNRLGISVSKKVGKSVVRSHVTRLIRESYRSMEEEVKSGYDFVVIARVSCAAASYHEVCRSLRHLFKKQQLLLSASERKDRQEKSEAGRKEEKKEGTMKEKIISLVNPVSLFFQKIFLLMIRFYQAAISPHLGKNCRFTPTCSQYAYIAITRFGPIKGTYLAIKRLLKCHPFHAGGYDPVPEKKEK